MKVIAFVNCSAGGNRGEVVRKILVGLLGAEFVHDIKKDGGPDKGLDKHCADPAVQVRIVVAGGDGTFSWVATSVEEKKLSNVYLNVIPLGSGNDMSRALGWGHKYPGDSRITRYIDWLRKAPEHVLDVWKLVATEDPSKVDATGNESDTSHSARPLMCNYLSFGADAYVELKFNQLRWKSPEKYKSRIGNFKAHVKVGIKYMMRPRKRKFFVSEHVEQLLVDGKVIDLPTNLQALIILNIPSYGAGTQPWGTVKGSNETSDLISGIQVSDMYVNDGSFEVIGLTGLPHYSKIKLFGSTGVRITQGKSLKVSLKSDATPFQVDGEPWQQRGGEVNVKKGNPVGVLVGPIWKGTSKKNAKFAVDDGATEEDSESDQ